MRPVIGLSFFVGRALIRSEQKRNYIRERCVGKKKFTNMVQSQGRSPLGGETPAIASALKPAEGSSGVATRNRDLPELSLKPPLVHIAGMNARPRPDQPNLSRRNKTFEATHQALIEASVELISKQGVAALTIAGLARAVGMNRATVYYHFANREALLEAVSAWSSAQLTRGFAGQESQQERIDFVARFVLENPDLTKLWIEQFIAPGDIRSSYPKWDEFIAAIGPIGAATVDVEVYCTILLAGAIIGPRVFHNSVRPDLSEEEVIERFRAEQQRMLRRDGMLRE